MATFELRQAVYFRLEIEADSLQEAEEIASKLSYEDMDAHDEDVPSLEEITD